MRERPNSNNKRQDALIAKALARAINAGLDVDAAFPGTWTPIAAGATVAVAPNSLNAYDSTGAQVVFNLPTAPPNDTSALFKALGSTFPNPALFNAGAGDILELPQRQGTFSAIAGQSTNSIPGQIYALKYQTAGARWIEFIPGPVGLMARVVSSVTAIFTDFQNLSTLANDNNSGADAAHPILTMAEFNRRVFMTQFTVLTATFLSDIVPGTTVDLSTSSFSIGIIIQGTPVVTGGAVSTLTTVTDINPAAQQVELVTDVGRGSFAARVGDLLVITSGPRSGNSAWIADVSVPATAKLTRPMTAANGVGVALLQAGDTYQIQRGSNVQFAGFPSPGAIPAFIFNDLTVTGNFSIYGVGNPQCNRCSFDNANIIDMSEGLILNNCGGCEHAYSSAPSGLTANGGLSPENYSCLQLNLQNDVWIISTIDIGAPGSIGGSIQGVQRCLILSGAQFHTSSTAALEINASGSLLLSSLIWGNDNGGWGIRIHPGAVQHTQTGLDPIVTGSSGDFTFEGLGADQPSGNTVSQAGIVGVNTATTWANYAGAFGRNCHRVDLNAAILLSAR